LLRKYSTSVAEVYQRVTTERLISMKYLENDDGSLGSGS
jgi:hypothetical protein